MHLFALLCQGSRDYPDCHSEEWNDEESYSTDFLLFAWWLSKLVL